MKGPVHKTGDNLTRGSSRPTQSEARSVAVKRRLQCLVRQGPRVICSVHRFALYAYWITSSARNRSVGGIVIPSTLAVFRLITSANFAGCSTGRSAGLALFRMRST